MTSLWAHKDLYESSPGILDACKRGLTLGEGGTKLTPHPALAAACGVRELFLKREDQNPSGSHKDRGLLYQVAHHAPGGGQTFILSSSGNAAVSAGAACRATHNRLVAFVSPHTDESKMRRLRQTDAVVLVCPKPINFARYAARVFGLTNLRGTKDPVASIGYRSIAGELSSELKRLDALFTFSSSGISMNGIADGFECLELRPRLWSVQSGECLGIVRAIAPETEPDPESPAGRLGVRNPPGGPALAERLLASGGGAIAVNSNEVLNGQRLLEAEGVETSPEGAAVVAAIQRCTGLGDARVVAVMTGRASGLEPSSPEGTSSPPLLVESYLDVRGFFEGNLGMRAV